MKNKYSLESFLVILAFLVICIVYWKWSDAIGLWSVTANPVLATVVNVATNPFYAGTFILIFLSLFGIYKLQKNFWNVIRVSVSSILISLAMDILTLVHSVPINYDLSKITSETAIYFDSILAKALQHILPHNMLGTFILYVIIPTLMIVSALLIVNPKMFTYLIKGEVSPPVRT